MLDLTDQEIADAYEQYAPEMLMVWCFKLKEERDALVKRLEDMAGAILDAYNCMEGAISELQYHKSFIESFKDEHYQFLSKKDVSAARKTTEGGRHD